MRTLWVGVVFLAASSAVFGQLDDNTLTITASRTMDVQPDQVIVGVYVNAPFDNTVDDILGALQGSGVTSANLWMRQRRCTKVFGVPIGHLLFPFRFQSSKAHWQRWRRLSVDSPGRVWTCHFQCKARKYLPNCRLRILAPGRPW